MQRAPGAERLFRVPYGDGELEFMLQPWFDIDVVASGSMDPVGDVERAAHDALVRPRGAPPLADLARDAVAKNANARARTTRSRSRFAFAPRSAAISSKAASTSASVSGSP